VDGSTLAANDRQGSHNLVLGRYNRFPEDGAANLVGGMSNTALGDSCFVMGHANTVNGEQTAILSGWLNKTNGFYTSVTGGRSNDSEANYDVIVGGSSNKAPYGDNFGASVIVGGQNNTDQSEWSVILAGISLTNNTNSALIPLPTAN
jgi:hypothetical protein